jgi:hypothetical protein
MSKPCKRCGGTDRYPSGGCKRCVSEQRKLWQQNNPERVKETLAAWIAKKVPCKRCGGTKRGANGTCSACAAADTKQWKKDNPEKNKAHRKAWHKKNPDKQRARTNKYHAAHPEKRKVVGERYRANHPEKVRETRRRVVAAWTKANPEKVKANAARHRAGKIKATPTWANKFFMEEAYALALLRSATLGFDWHVDHIVPLNSKIVCGLHVEHNLQVIPALHNLTKSNLIWPDQP